MAIVATDIKKRFSVAAAAGNTTAGTAATSLGDQISTTDITDATLNNLFDDISAAENAALTSDYRCIFVLNNHATLSLTGVSYYLVSETAGGANISISLDTGGVTAKGLASAQAKTIANETTAPASQTFTSPVAAGVLTGADIPAGSCQAIWIKRTALGGAAQADGVVLRVTGTTAP